MQYQDSPMTTSALSARKRLFGLIVTTSVIPIVLPVIASLALAVWAVHGLPIIFTQQRPGPYGRPFMLMKFRSMTNACDQSGRLLPDAERLTRFGRFLRSTSLDELPELLNVLKGEMSLVGPRPYLMEYLEPYTA
jgi:lipopolysaccharide/colanic/teichoic acid biosynthesis glycosyltransferase